MFYWQNQSRNPFYGDPTTQEKDNQVLAYVFPKQTCNKCSLKDQCTPGKGKIVTLHEQEERRREKRIKRLPHMGAWTGIYLVKVFNSYGQQFN